MPFISVIVVFVLYLFSPNSFAGDLYDMLQRMSEADRNQSYRGTFILRKSDDLSTLLVRHGRDENGVWESLETLNGESRKVIRRNNKVITVYPEDKLLTIRQNTSQQSLHPRLPDNIDQLELFYSINRLDDDRIANHQTLVVDLIPKDELRYSYRYWVDKTTGMLLRCDLFDEDKTVVEQMMFTSLDYLTESPAQLFELKQYKQFQKQEVDEPESDIQNDVPVQWAVNILPQGFMLTQRTMRHSKKPAVFNAGKPNSSSPDLLHLVYSDGLASVSVFIEKKLGNEKRKKGASSMGAVNAFAHVVDDYFVTVVGEVPVKTVQSMAQSTVKLK